MTIPAISMVPGWPYVVARSSAALHLRRGDHVQISESGEMIGPHGPRYGAMWRVYQLSVDLDVGGLLDLRASIIADAERRVAEIDKAISERIEG
jgi:hypothetical protein